MRGILLFFAVLANLLWLPFSAALAEPDALPSADFSEMKHTGGGRVLQVISPQEIQLADGRIVKLSGLHFPDYSTEDTGPFAMMAMRIMTDMLTDQDVLLYQTNDEKLGRVDRMGRQIAHVVRKKDGAWIQGSLLALGLSVARTTQRTPEMIARMLEQEAKARSEKLGLWEETISILSPEEAGEHIGSFQIVEGRVESAALNKNRIYLNFGKNWREDFTVTIAPENRKAFSRQQINPLDWNGQILQVRGWISSYNGPSMEIDHPEAVEILSGDTSAPAAMENKETEQPSHRKDALPPPLPVKSEKDRP